MAQSTLTAANQDKHRGQNMQDSIKLVGTPTFTLTDEFGNVKHKFAIPNLVVTTGKNLFAAVIGGTSNAKPSHMAVGTGATPAQSTQTTLSAPAGTRVAFTSTSVALNTISYQSVFGPGVGTGALTEAGLFNDSSAGTMVTRTVFPVFTKESSDSLTINWDITIN